MSSEKYVDYLHFKGEYVKLCWYEEIASSKRVIDERRYTPSGHELLFWAPYQSKYRAKISIAQTDEEGEYTMFTPVITNRPFNFSPEETIRLRRDREEQLNYFEMLEEFGDVNHDVFHGTVTWGRELIGNAPLDSFVFTEYGEGCYEVTGIKDKNAEVLTVPDEVCKFSVRNELQECPNLKKLRLPERLKNSLDSYTLNHIFSGIAIECTDVN